MFFVINAFWMMVILNVLNVEDMMHKTIHKQILPLTQTLIDAEDAQNSSATALNVIQPVV